MTPQDLKWIEAHASWLYGDYETASLEGRIKISTLISACKAYDSYLTSNTTHHQSQLMQLKEENEELREMLRVLEERLDWHIENKKTPIN